jgi:hypothetical protein
MTNDEHSERQEALGPPVQRPVGRLAPWRDDAGLQRCPYCGQPDVGWADGDLARGRRDGTGYVQYHCYAAKCMD